MTMKIAAALAALPAASAFAPVAGRRATTTTALNAKAGVYYSTQTGNTETVAGYIAAAAGGLEIADIGDSTAEDLAALDTLIVGAPTWHTDADMERSGTEWDTWLYETLPGLDLKGKKVAVFGVGDQQSYNEYYCDAAGELYDLFEKAGCTMVGRTATDGYDHSSSKADRDGQFVGLMCDEDNQYDMSEERANAWVEQLKGEGAL